MLFNSIHFLIFFPIVIFLYFVIPFKYRWLFLVLASYYFYMVGGSKYVILLIVSTLVSYVGGRLIGGAVNKKRKKFYLIISLLIIFGQLFVFKYFNFFNDSLRLLLEHFNIFYGLSSFRLLLPVGISFFTFQTAAYLIDVYRGKQPPEKHLGIFAAFVSFFPQLISGPIPRANQLLPQFFQKKNFEWRRLINGAIIMLWGFFKKLVIADNIAPYVAKIYDSPVDFAGPVLFFVSILFAFQLYCDFSGYSDIAIGVAQILGYDLMKNFDRPFSAKSISDFWKRWHISLTSWFQDYVFVPMYLAVSRSKFLQKMSLSFKFKHVFSFIISTVVGLVLLGLWHGAGWTFVVFGSTQAFFLVFYHFIQKPWDKIPGAIRIMLTFLMFSFGAVFFRAHSFTDAIYIITHFFQGFSLKMFVDLVVFKDIFTALGLTVGNLFLILFSLLLLFVAEKKFVKGDIRDWLGTKSGLVRWCVTYLLFFLILFFGHVGEVPFIYFQF